MDPWIHASIYPWIHGSMGLWWPNGSQMTSGESSWVLLSSGGQMALRWPLEAHFELFWALVVKWLSDGSWRLILSSSGLWWPNASQMVSGDSFWALLSSGDQSSALTANSDKISIPRRFANPISCSAEGAHSPQIATKPPSQGDLQTLQLFNQSSALTANSYKISIPRRLANPISCSAKVVPSPQIVTKSPFQGDLQTLSIVQPK